MISAQLESPESTSKGKTTPPPPESKAQTRVVQIPISLNEWAALQVPIPLTEEKWGQMIAVLNAMKPGIVTAAKGSSVCPESAPLQN